MLQKLLSKLSLTVHTQGKGKVEDFHLLLKESQLSKLEKNLNCAVSPTLNWIMNWTNHAGWFPPSVLVHFEVCSASSDIFLWKLLSLSSELNNLKVKQTGPNWLILFSFFFTNGPNHYDLVWQNPILSFPILISPCDHRGWKKSFLCRSGSLASDHIFLWLIWNQQI